MVGFYHANGTLGLEVTLDDPRVVRSIDPETGEVVFVLSADHLPILLTDPDGSGSTNYEAYALTNTSSGEVLDFYDIGGGTQNITAQGGAADEAVSVNLPVLVGPQATTTSIQFNQPNPDEITYAEVGAGDTGIACFVAGTLLDTPNGPRAIETLDVGDMVTTHDNGPRPVRWIGQRTVSALGEFAPICFQKGAHGVTRPVLVSPQHRVLVSGWQVELHCGEDEVLVPAKALVDGETVIQAPRGAVTYVHLLFEEHEILRSSGLMSESYFPLANVEEGWGDETAQELAALFPEIAEAALILTARAVQTVRLGKVLRAA